MTKPKYAVIGRAGPNSMLWDVILKGRIKLMTFIDKREAERYAQACVEDDAWHASNRD